MRLKLPACPNCGKKINWFRAGALKTQGEYRCGKCGACSNVFLDRLIYPLAIVAAAAGAVFFILFVALVREFSFTALLLIAAPFFVFFLASPFFVRLRPLPPPGQAAPPRRPVRRRPEEAPRAKPPAERPGAPRQEGKPANPARRRPL